MCHRGTEGQRPSGVGHRSSSRSLRGQAMSVWGCGDVWENHTWEGLTWAFIMEVSVPLHLGVSRGPEQPEPDPFLLPGTETPRSSQYLLN